MGVFDRPVGTLCTCCMYDVVAAFCQRSVAGAVAVASSFVACFQTLLLVVCWLVASFSKKHALLLQNDVCCQCGINDDNYVAQPIDK